jgi:hypothetical protein
MKHGYDSECLRLAKHFFSEDDPRLDEIAQSIQDTVESFPDEPLKVFDGETKP